MGEIDGLNVSAEGNASLDPSLIMQVGMGFWPSKVLLSAVELGLFSTLGTVAMTGREIAEHHGLRSRAVFDFLDGLVALRLLDRDGGGEEAALPKHRRHGLVSRHRLSPAYIGGILEMANARLYRFWGGLTEALRTGAAAERDQAHRHARCSTELYADPDAARAVHARHVRHLGRQLPCPGREVRFLAATRRCAMSAGRPASSRSSWRSTTRICAAPASTCRSWSRSRDRTIAEAKIERPGRRRWAVTSSPTRCPRPT